MMVNARNNGYRLKKDKGTKSEPKRDMGATGSRIKRAGLPKFFDTQVMPPWFICLFLDMEIQNLLFLSLSFGLALVYSFFEVPVPPLWSDNTSSLPFYIGSDFTSFVIFQRMQIKKLPWVLEEILASAQS